MEKNKFQMNNPSINKKINKFYLSDNKKIFQTEVLIAIVKFLAVVSHPMLCL